MASPAKAKISTKILPMVDLKDIRKSFGDLEVVKGLDLEIGSGEFLTSWSIRVRKDDFVANDSWV